MPVSETPTRASGLGDRMPAGTTGHDLVHVLLGFPVPATHAIADDDAYGNMVFRCRHCGATRRVEGVHDEIEWHRRHLAWRYGFDEGFL